MKPFIAIGIAEKQGTTKTPNILIFGEINA
jgi:hypothetical protein